jgi:hypothetical protein
MRQEYEGIDDRKAFKHFMGRDELKISFKKRNAIVEYQEPYIVDEKSLQIKSDIKRFMQQSIIEYRNYCFNNSN